MSRNDWPNVAHRIGDHPVTRFAPSPTGYLHLGHVVNAIYVWGIAHALGGSVKLRIEDHDRIRSRPEYEQAMHEDLAWLGFAGPDRTGTIPVGRQSDDDEVYREALGRLRETHHVYACDCSRSAIGQGPYPGRCRSRGVEELPGVGLRVELSPGDETFDDLRLGRLTQAPHTQCGDLLLRDRDGHWTYQFAVTVDDLRQGVNLVIRGEDLLSSTGRQQRLARMLEPGDGAPRAAPVYLHHPLIMGTDDKKLSKSTGADGVRTMRHRGLSPSEVIGRAAAAVGLVTDGIRVTADEVGSLVTRAINGGELTLQERNPHQS